jgi:hypothetical protein
MASLEGWNFTIKLCPRDVRSELGKVSRVNSDWRMGNSQSDWRTLRARPAVASYQCEAMRRKIFPWQKSVRNPPPARLALPYFSNATATSVALWPPKPKELFNVTRTFFSRATFGV